jgi:hypothetical protein
MALEAAFTATPTVMHLVDLHKPSGRGSSTPGTGSRSDCAPFIPPRQPLPRPERRTKNAHESG